MRLSVEELARLMLIKETVQEMADEVDDMPPGEVYEIRRWLIFTKVKIMSILARYSLNLDLELPTPPSDDVPW